MHRFFVPASWLQEEEISLTGPLAHQLSRVLRLRPGAHIVLLDDSGWAYEVVLERVSPERVTAHIVATSQPQTEPRVRLRLCQALIRENKFDWVLQKGTELGVSTFVPLSTERSLIQAAEAFGTHKMARWQRIVTEAAEQSGRARLPKVLSPKKFSDALRDIPMGALALIACLSPESKPLGQILRSVDTQNTQEICLFVGPEGDFTPAEVEHARRAGVLPVSLGPRILRTETAGLVALSVVLYALGEMD